MLVVSIQSGIWLRSCGHVIGLLRVVIHLVHVGWCLNGSLRLSLDLKRITSGRWVYMRITRLQSRPRSGMIWLLGMLRLLMFVRVMMGVEVVNWRTLYGGRLALINHRCLNIKRRQLRLSHCIPTSSCVPEVGAILTRGFGSLTIPRLDLRRELRGGRRGNAMLRVLRVGITLVTFPVSGLTRVLLRGIVRIIMLLPLRVQSVMLVDTLRLRRRLMRLLDVMRIFDILNRW